MTGDTGRFLSGTSVYSKYWYNINLETHQLKSGEKFDFLIVDAPDWVMIIPELDDGRLLLTRQYRPAWRESSIEFPAGKINPGESQIQTAKRELQEETGYSSGHYRKLISSRPINWTTQSMSIYHSYGLVEGKQNLDPEEEIEILKLTAEEVREYITAGNIKQSHTIMAFCLWQNRSCSTQPITDKEDK